MISDWHINAWYSKFDKGFSYLKEQIATVKPQNIVINGDMLDNGPPRIKEKDFERVITAIKELQSAAPKAKLYINYGNHEKTVEFDEHLREKIPEAIIPDNDKPGYHFVDNALITHGDTIMEREKGENYKPTLNRRDLIKTEAQAASVSFKQGAKDFIMASAKTLIPAFIGQNLSSKVMGHLSEKRYPIKAVVDNTITAIRKEASTHLENGPIDIVVGHSHPAKAQLNLEVEDTEHRMHVASSFVKGNACSIIHLQDSKTVAEDEKRLVQDIGQQALGRAA